MAVVREFPTITEEALEELRSRIGVEVEGPQAYLTEVSRDATRHWADGIGDRNQLWTDEERGLASRWQAPLAPPTMLYGFSRICSGYVGGLPGIHAMFAGTDFRWTRPLRQGDRIQSVAHLAELVDRQSEFSGRAVQQIYRVVYRNQSGEVVCEADSWCFRTQRDAARERNTYEKAQPPHYSPEEVEDIRSQYAREEIRGAKPRFWEDVEVGEVLPPVLKGPLTVTSMIAFDQGWGGLYLRGHGLAFDMFNDHPALGIPNAFGVPEPPERVHWDPDLARRVGVSGPYDYGPERVSWLGHLVTNWMSDDGFLMRLNAQVRRHNLVGDLTRCTGSVLRKWTEDGQALVECEVEAKNQRDEVTAKGQAVVALPTRTAAGNGTK